MADTPEQVEPAEIAKGMERHALLSEQFDKVESEQAETAAEKPVKEASEPKEPEVSADGRVRQPDGKFAPRTAEKTAAPVAPPAVEEPLWKRPPKSWKSERHELWGKASTLPELQQYVHEREDQMRKGVEPLIAKAQFADSMQKVIEPHMQTIRGLGIDAPTAVASLMKADHILRTSDPQSKIAYFKKLATQYGITLDGTAEPRPDPNFALAQELNQLKGELLSWKEQQEQVKNLELQSEIEKFASDASNVHFEAARPTMVRLLQSGEADTLKAAYKKALRVDDALYELTQAKPTGPTEAEKRVAADKAAKVARSAAVSVKGSTPGTHSTTKAQDRRSMLIEQFDGLSERL